jgi:hypothetical protein
MEGDFSHRDLMALYRAANVVVTEHPHSFIFAAMVGTPGLVMSVDGHEVDGVALPEWVVIDSATDGAATVLERVCRLRRRTAVSADLRRASAKARAFLLGFAGELAALARQRTG